MTSFLQAREIVLSRAAPLPPEEAPLLEAVGRVLAADVAAPVDFPRFDNSAMDGWALRAEDAAGRRPLPVTGFVPAGAAGAAPLAPGTAVRIMTGAPVPAGADAILPLEEGEEREGTLHPQAEVRPGMHVRRRGDDMAAGEVALHAGAVIGPREVSFLAASGRLRVAVHRRPRVAILSTGDELVEVGAPVGPGQIPDSNGLAVAAAVLEAGGVPVPLGIARDEPEALRALVARGLEADLLVTTAGVSMGDRDHVREVLASLGVEPIFFTIEAKPGHPTAFGVRGATAVLSLPGNPVSSLLMFEQLARPALLRMQGYGALLRPLVPAVLDEPLTHRLGRVTFARVKLAWRDGALHARSAGKQETAFIRPLIEADGIAHLPPERGDAPAGTPVMVQLLGGAAPGAAGRPAWR